MLGLQNKELNVNASSNNVGQMQFMNTFYISTACHVCKLFTVNLKRCGSCKLFAYCCSEHQKLHWKDHKIFCKMVYELLKFGGKNRHHIYDLSNIEKLTWQEWKSVQTGVKTIWENKLKRKLTNIENQLWMLPRICEVCRFSQQDSLIDCAICYSASYCSIEHRQVYSNIHDQYCKTFQLYYETNIYQGTHGSPTYSFSSSSNLKNLPVNTDAFVRECTCINQDNNIVRIIVGDIMSPCLTLIYALQQSNFVNNRSCYKQKLVIHFVGAALYEQLMPCDFIFQWIENINDLTLVLIGPETMKEETKKTVDCQGEMHNISTLIEPSLYHDYADSESFIIPDIIVGFNSGLHEFQNTEDDSWSKSLNCFFKFPNVLLVFTSYTEAEAHMDLERLLPYVVQENQLLIRCEKNQFASPRPLRDWETENIPIFYTNNYLSLLKTT